MPTPTFRKTLPHAPTGYARWEATGLRWLGAAYPGCVPDVTDVGEHHLVMTRLRPVPASPGAAEEFGRMLAAVHGAGAAAYGAPPDGWTGDGWLGPADEPLPLPLNETRPALAWGEFWADLRIGTVLTLGLRRGIWTEGDLAPFRSVADRARGGDFDDGERPARLHGDLWAGNLLFTAEGPRMIDPAAHGGHRETDLAMLALFGAPHLGRILAAYDEVHPLADGWRARVGLHQLHPLLLHAVLFGGGYAAQARSAAARYA